jgi:hypothetical protein
MKKSITVVALFAAAVCMQAAEDNKSEKTATAPEATAIPKDAVKNADGTYSYTDKDGKKWTYRNSPFGVIKAAVREPGADTRPKPSQPAAATTKAIDKGDTVQFERSTPFGPQRWEKKKSDLNAEERRILDAQNESESGGKTQSNTESARPDAK